MTTPIDAAVAWYERAKATATVLRTDHPAYAAAAEDLAAAHVCLARILRARQTAHRAASGLTYSYRAAEDSVVVAPPIKGRKGQTCKRETFRTPDPQESARQDYVRQAAADRAAVIPERFANQEG